MVVFHQIGAEKKDEDDWAWRRRSFGMALHLMKPSKKRNIKR